MRNLGLATDIAVNNPTNLQLEKMASRIIELGLAQPALFLLEAHKPLSTLVSNFAIFCSPFLSPILGNIRMHAVHSFFSDRGNTEQLIQLLEKGAK